MRLRLAAAATLSAVAAFALPGHAAPAPQITDAVGDVVVPEASLDVVSGLFSTQGVKLGKKYKPTKLVATITYAAEPNTSELATQVVMFDLPGCGEIYLQRYFGGTYGTAECIEDAFDFTAKVTGKTITYTLTFTTLGKSMKPGVVLSSLRTYTSGADPVLGYSPADFNEALVADHASTTKTFKVA